MDDGFLGRWGDCWGLRYWFSPFHCFFLHRAVVIRQVAVWFPDGDDPGVGIQAPALVLLAFTRGSAARAEVPLALVAPRNQSAPIPRVPTPRRTPVCSGGVAVVACPGTTAIRTNSACRCCGSHPGLFLCLLCSLLVRGIRTLCRLEPAATGHACPWLGQLRGGCKRCNSGHDLGRRPPGRGGWPGPIFGCDKAASSAVPFRWRPSPTSSLPSA